MSTTAVTVPPSTPPAANAPVAESRTCILGGQNAIKNAVLAATAAGIAIIAYVFFSEIEVFINSGLLAVAIIGTVIALTEAAFSNMPDNPTVRAAHANLDQAVALGESAIHKIRNILSSAFASLPTGTVTLATQTVTDIGNQVVGAVQHALENSDTTPSTTPTSPNN